MNNKYKSSIAVVCYKRKGEYTYLFGLSQSEDDRFCKFCFPGGGIKPGESFQDAAVRECREETGVIVKATQSFLEVDSKPGVIFIYCIAASPAGLKQNHEFSVLGWFSREEMQSIDIYKGNKRILQTLEDDYYDRDSYQLVDTILDRYSNQQINRLIRTAL